MIIQTAFIGDAILASSLAEKLHACLPSASVSILVRRGNETIYEGHPFLKEILIWDKTSGKIANLFKMLFAIRRKKYDCVVNCHRYASSGLLTAFSGARHTAGYKQNPFSFLFNYTVKHQVGDGRHETNRYNQLITDFTGEEVFKPVLYPTQSDFESVKSYRDNAYVCMAPASVWFTKQLPLEKWITLSDKIDPAITIYLLGGAGDHELCEKISAGSTHPRIKVLAGKLSLLGSGALMTGAKMNYVNDSAPLHLASATNSPVTAFFCSTVPQFGFGPLSDNSTVLGMDELNCRPCGLHGHKVCPLGHFKCGHLLDLSRA